MTAYQCRYDLKRVCLPTPSENNCVRFSEDVRTIDEGRTGGVSGTIHGRKK